MNKYVSLDKRSKKAQREYHAEQRRTWGDLNPVTRSVPSGKTYCRASDYYHWRCVSYVRLFSEKVKNSDR